MFHGFNTSVSPESSEEVWEVWGAPERSGEVWTGPGRSGEVWGAPERSGELQRGLGSYGELRGATERSGGLGSLQSSDRPGPRLALQNIRIRLPKTRKTRKIQNIITNML